MSEFDKVAADWDKNQMRTNRAEAIAEKLLPYLESKNYQCALEFGAGTGLLSFVLKDKFKSLILMDNSQEMVKVANSKIIESGQHHMKAVFFDLEQNDYHGRKFDVIFSQMVMHHVGNVDRIFQKFSNLMVSGGLLAIADLCTEDGTFHGEGFTGYLGFDPEQLKPALLSKGFTDVSSQICFNIQKEINNAPKDFPVFLLTAIKE